ncbi:MAG: hypothetical protein IKU39_07585 [Lachnospiraceae bacterium]|nr:hypothetical protein [Lachnospiraceae bacterium]
MSKIQEALDLVENLLDGTEHIKNTIELLGVGYYNDHNDCKDCEVSSLYILGQYIELVQEEQLMKLCDLLEEMK